MDNPKLDAPAHLDALRGLARLNRLSRTAESLWTELQRLEVGRSHRPIRVLDLACGGGDITRRLAVLARHDHLPFTFDGCDLSSRAIDFARNHPQSTSLNCQFFIHDALRGPLPGGYDYFISSLFIHHLESAQITDLLHRMAQGADQGLVIHDLRRSLRGLWLAGAASRLFTRSPVVHTDALLSVRAAFTLSEMRALAAEAGLTAARCTPHWPQRWLLSWTA